MIHGPYAMATGRACHRHLAQRADCKRQGCVGARGLWGGPCVGRAVLWVWEHGHPPFCCRASWGTLAVTLTLPSLSAQGFLEQSTVLVPSEMGPAALQPHNPLVSRPQNLERVWKKRTEAFRLHSIPRAGLLSASVWV